VLFLQHARLRAQTAPGISRALFFEGGYALENLGEKSRRGKDDLRQCECNGPKRKHSSSPGLSR
jgi:hypothetical protein